MAKKASLIPVEDTTVFSNLERLNTQFENTLSLDGSLPNAMNADLDMNNNDILNAGAIYSTSFEVGGLNVFLYIQRAEQAAQDSEQSAQDARDVIDNLSVSSTTLPPLSQASASYDPITSNIEIGIPQGTQGIQGPPGPDGPTGPQGADSFVQGPVGPIGPDGLQGPTGPDGPQGPIGPDGPVGPDGPRGIPGADSTVPGPPGNDGADGNDGQAGADGPSAYEVAVAEGFQGSESDWLASLVGERGPQGLPGQAGAGTGDMLGSNNLSDLTDVAVARTTLGLGSAAIASTGSFATYAQGQKADTALQNASAFATAAQGGKADTALQDATAFATKAQGDTADSALQTGDLISELIESGTAKIMTGAERTKLTGITPQATKNQTDAYLLDRSNHNGNIPNANVTGLGSAALVNTSTFATSAQGTLATNALAKSQNLADLGNAGSARSNLGLGTAAQAATGDFATAAQGTLATNAIPTPPSGARGDILIRDATKWTRLPKGSTGQVLTQGSTTPVWSVAPKQIYVQSGTPVGASLNDLWVQI